MLDPLDPQDIAGAKETGGALRRTFGIVLPVASLLLCGFYVWLKIARGVSYVGPVPTPAPWLLPGIAGCWLGIWPQWQVRVLALATAVLLVALAVLFVVR